MLQEALSFISNIITPAKDLIDEVITSEEEKLQLKNTLKSIENELASKQLEILSKQIELEKENNDLKAKIISTEANNESWLSRSWRPITMLIFVGIILLYVLGLINIENSFAQEFLGLVKIGLGGYVIGRSAEKTSSAIYKIIKN